MWSTAWSVALVVALQAAPQPTQSSQDWPDDRPFSQFFSNLGRDLSALPSRETAATLAVGVAGTAGAHALDDRLSEWVDRQPSASYTRVGRFTGDGWTQGGLAVGAYVVGRIAGSPRLTHVGSDLVRAQVLNGVITTGLKYVAGRERPNSSNRRSFPSGHASATFATAATLHGHFGWKAAVPGYAVAGFVGWTRARDNVHWLSDVAMGATIGIVTGRTVTRGHRARAWQVVPAKTAGGFAVYFIRSPD